MFQSLSAEFGEALKGCMDAVGEGAILDIPSSFYTETLKEFLSVSEERRLRAIGPSILRQLVEQLDPNQRGIAVVVACITHPAESQGVVRSLHSVFYAGNGVWAGEGNYNNVFQGAESLSGYALAQMQSQTIQFVAQEHEGQVPVSRIDEVGSAAAFPIKRGDRVGGCAIVWSGQREYFTPARTRLLEQYVNLLALILEQQDFHDPQNIRLELLPVLVLQQAVLCNFRQRLMAVLRESAQHQTLGIPQAEQVVLSQMEGELVSLARAGQSKLASI
jgi:hypothetical protein